MFAAVQCCALLNLPRVLPSFDVRHVEGGAVDACKGILSRAGENSALALDLSRQLWGDLLKKGADPKAATKLTAEWLDPIDREAFRKVYFEQAYDSRPWASFKRVLGLGGPGFGDTALQALAGKVWGTSNLAIFDRFHMAANDDSNGRARQAA